MRYASVIAAGAALWCACGAKAADQDWKASEADVLSEHVQLTFEDQFLKAGESYFSPDDSMIIFQGIEQPAEGEAPDEFYAMYVGDVVRDADGQISSMANIRRISPEGSANTCGWFHPTRPGIVIFGSTVTPPVASDAPGYQRGGGRYKWQFPPEMNIVEVDLAKADGTADSLKTLIEASDAYIAECSYSPDGRHLLYCSLESGEGDLFVRDERTGTVTRIVEAAGYDGGPFFSPDGRRICFRSDRTGDNLLQIFVGELAFNREGTIVGIEREFQLTDNGHVNWAPYWTTNGRALVYATSEMGHQNYEVFMVDADDGRASASRGTAKYGTTRTRITHAPGFDGLPVFNRDGSVMMWTSQRGADSSSQLWCAAFSPSKGAVTAAAKSEQSETESEGGGGGFVSDTQITVEDPESGLFYIYDTADHSLIAYDVSSHTTREVTDPEEMSRALELFDAQAP